MQAWAWSNGGSGYGLAIRVEDRDRFFDQGWPDVVLDLAGQGQTVVPVSPSFWRGCPELRSAEIGRWLHQNGLAPWPRGRRPKVTIEHVAGNSFRVKVP